MPTPLPFNANWYLQQNPDVAAAIAGSAPFNAQEHFMLYGRAEGRSASPVFDSQQYLASNPDVAQAVAQGLITAWDHFELFGGTEGRSPTPLGQPSHTPPHKGMGFSVRALCGRAFGGSPLSVSIPECQFALLNNPVRSGERGSTNGSTTVTPRQVKPL